MGSSWERQDHETDKAWDAFCIYRDLPLYGADNTRSLETVARQIGHKSASTVEGWSSKYAWVSRARAYDAHNQKITMTVREKSLIEFQKDVIHNTSLQLSVLRRVIENKLSDAVSNPDTYDTLSLQRLAKTIETADNLGRRIAQLPTTYTSESVADEPQDVYIIGAIDDET